MHGVENLAGGLTPSTFPLVNLHTDYEVFDYLFDRIADNILESCVNDVIRELDEINSDIVDHVYSSEFTVVQWLENL